MQQAVAARTPAHVWIVGVLSLLWGCFGAYDYTMTRMRNTDYIANAMPGGISGLELARKVRNRYPELPILLTTGYSEQVTGAHGFEVLQKPYELVTLSAAVEKVMKQGVSAH